jgi:hypothetical protein
LAEVIAARYVMPRKYEASIEGLGRAIEFYTDYEVHISSQVRLSSDDIMKYPFLYMPAEDAIELTDFEKANLKEYMSYGGLVLFEPMELKYDVSISETSFRKLMKDLFGSQGVLERIPADHPIYSSYFTFNNAPTGYRSANTRGGRSNYSAGYYEDRPGMFNPETTYLEGISVNGQIVAIFSDKQYGKFWKAETNNDQQLKIAINMIMYSMKN